MFANYSSTNKCNLSQKLKYNHELSEQNAFNFPYGEKLKNTYISDGNKKDKIFHNQEQDDYT